MARLIVLLMIAFLPGHAVCAGPVAPRENPESLRAETHTESHKIGRLFFSPDERAMLDRIRQKSSGNTVSTTEQVTLNGIVRRSSGKKHRLDQSIAAARERNTPRYSRSAGTSLQTVRPAGTAFGQAGQFKGRADIRRHQRQSTRGLRRRYRPPPQEAEK